MARKSRKKIVPVNPTRRRSPVANVTLEKELARVVYVGWQIRRGERYFGVIQRADGTVERMRLERDDLQAAADFVTAHKLGAAKAIRARQLRRLT